MWGGETHKQSVQLLLQGLVGGGHVHAGVLEGERFGEEERGVGAHLAISRLHTETQPVTKESRIGSRTANVVCDLGANPTGANRNILAFLQLIFAFLSMNKYFFRLYSAIHH